MSTPDRERDEMCERLHQYRIEVREALNRGAMDPAAGYELLLQIEDRIALLTGLAPDKGE